MKISEKIRAVVPCANILTLEEELLIRTQSFEDCLRLFEHRYLWQSRGLGVTLQHKSGANWRTFDSSFLLENDDASTNGIIMKPEKYFWDGYSSEWLSENREAFGQFAPTEFIYRADQAGRDQGLPCVAIKTWHPSRINKPIDETLGAPLYDVDELIAFPRARAIANAASSKTINTRVNYYYEYDWEGRTWKFECTAQKVSESEVLVLLFDVGFAQRDYWLSRL